ncbi:MAG TPA: hypothetical protein VL633_11040 [Bacteroidota bacterium]|jgi:hypothetical protein|nr:hypothetical protein [Bacteroidota bacterium]
MKRTIIFYVFLILVLFPSNSRAQGKSSGLVADPYPGSVPESHPNVTDAAERKSMDSRSRTYYTKDSFEKTMAHYTKSLGGKFEPGYGGDWVFSCAVIPYKDVLAIVEKRGGVLSEGGDNFGGTMAGVTIHGRPTNNATHYSVTQVYEKMQKAYLAKFSNSETVDLASLQQHLEDPELKKLETRYEHLKLDYFAETSEKRKEGGANNLTMDEVIYNKYFTNPAEARAKEQEELQKKYMAAINKMDYDGATKIGNRMMEISGIQPNDGKADMDTVIMCLEEMNTNAYATMIVIDMHPSKWEITPLK